MFLGLMRRKVMKKYEKPYILIDENIAEGVYAGSGGCYRFSANITQGPGIDQLEYYVIQVNGTHQAADGHHSSDRVVVIEFNKPISYLSSNATSFEINGTVLSLRYMEGKDQWGNSNHYHNNDGNPNEEYIGLGNLCVKADEGLAVISIYCSYCSEECIDPTHQR